MAKRPTSKQWLADKSSRELHDHYHALGVIENRWNVAEIQFQRVCWFFIGAGPLVGRATTNEMGNVTLGHFLLTLAQECVKDSHAIAFAKALANLFNVNRDNRNFLTHCRVTMALNLRGKGVAILQRFQAKGTFKHPMYLVPIGELRKVAEEIEAMNDLCDRFFDFVEAGGLSDRLPSLDIPAPPHPLAQRLLSFQPVAQTQRPPSRRKRG